MLTVRSYAKINWSLRITGKRADGYHDLETLFQQISLHDVLTFAPADALTLTCDDPSIPVDETNLVLRAARLLGAPPVAIALQKHIPAGGGLGGGSSNAAATLLTLNRMFSLGRRDLPELALQLGSDVPFFLGGGTAYAVGRGEVLTPLTAAAPIPLLLLLPEERVLTRDAFARIRTFSPPLGLDRYRAIVEDDVFAHEPELINDFEEPVFSLLPRLRELRDRLRATGAAWAHMSGSGSTIVGAFTNQHARDHALSLFDDIRAVAAETIGP
ncbi:MAG: 4-diphosphocytidyl-2-C-methyl-D-erythritol kinase [Acidobacteriota bacterium]|jgi:4-diphosphocytidyl-2-C-methyl-D-erythritol kinase|nr:4-diphosphocytidyl-2-C-methyl-D-erythritol kinase [Acidobacteriota bacterium]